MATISKIRLQKEQRNGIHTGEQGQIERILYDSIYGIEQEDIQSS